MISKEYIEAAFQVVNEIERRKNITLTPNSKLEMAISIASDMAKNHIKEAIVKGNGEPLTINVGTINILA